MRILVIIGQVLDPAGIIVNRRAGRIFVNREEYVLQPADRCALEAALRIKDSTGAEVVVVPRAPLPDDDVLRQALATGADRAIDLTGEGFAQADDAVMARVLTTVIEQLGGVDLILTGATTLDSGQGQLAPRVAQVLGRPQIAEAWDVTVDDGRARAVCRQGTGYVTVEADLPAVVTLLPGTLKPRYPDGARLVNIYTGVGEIAEALEQWDAVDLVGADGLAPLVERRGQDYPPERDLGSLASGSPEEMAQAAANALRQALRR